MLRYGRHGINIATVHRWTPVLLLGLLTLSGIVCASGAPAPLPALDRVTLVAAPRLIPDFQLTDQNGRPRTLASLRGKPTLVFFGFTHCPDVCPAALTKLKLLHDSNGGALRSAQVVFISVDGERDTPTVMKQYLAPLSTDFIGLTGNPRAVVDIAARFSAVAFKEDPDARGNYEYFHSSQVFVLDRDGRLRASFTDASVPDMATITRILLEEGSRGSVH